MCQPALLLEVLPTAFHKMSICYQTVLDFAVDRAKRQRQSGVDESLAGMSDEGRGARR